MILLAVPPSARAQLESRFSVMQVLYYFGTRRMKDSFIIYNIGCGVGREGVTATFI
jgi:hypothetical protein